MCAHSRIESSYAFLQPTVRHLQKKKSGPNAAARHTHWQEVATTGRRTHLRKDIFSQQQCKQVNATMKTRHLFLSCSSCSTKLDEAPDNFPEEDKMSQAVTLFL